MVEYLVGYSRVLNGVQRRFDEAASRNLVRRDVERARDVAALQNHDAISDDDRLRRTLSSIEVPTLVIHGTADPMFPLRHGEVLAEEIPGATLLPLDGAGHGVDEADWETVRGRDPGARSRSPDRAGSSSPRRPRSSCSGCTCSVLLFAGHVAVGGHAGGLVGELERCRSGT